MVWTITLLWENHSLLSNGWPHDLQLQHTTNPINQGYNIWSHCIFLIWKLRWFHTLCNDYIGQYGRLVLIPYWYSTNVFFIKIPSNYLFWAIGLRHKIKEKQSFEFQFYDCYYEFQISNFYLRSYLYI